MQFFSKHLLSLTYFKLYNKTNKQTKGTPWQTPQLGILFSSDHLD